MENRATPYDIAHKNKAGTAVNKKPRPKDVVLP
jgi:hypothetical protein